MEDTAHVLKEWLENKDKDLREWGSAQGTTERKTSLRGVLDCLDNTVRKRLHVKQSIDHTLNSLKGHSHLDSCTYMSADAKKLLLPGEHVLSLGSILCNHHHPCPDLTDKLLSRMPLLPHIYDDIPTPPPSNSQKPRLAGQDAQSEPPRAPNVPHKLQILSFELVQKSC